MSGVLGSPLRMGGVAAVSSNSGMQGQSLALQQFMALQQQQQYLALQQQQYLPQQHDSTFNGTVLGTPGEDTNEKICSVDTFLIFSDLSSPEMSQLTLMSLLQQQQQSSLLQQQQQSSALTGNNKHITITTTSLLLVLRQPPARPQPPLWLHDPWRPGHDLRGPGVSAGARHDLPDLRQPPVLSDLGDPRPRGHSGPRPQPPGGQQPRNGPGSQPTTGGGQQQQLPGLPHINR